MPNKKTHNSDEPNRLWFNVFGIFNWKFPTCIHFCIQRELLVEAACEPLLFLFHKSSLKEYINGERKKNLFSDINGKNRIFPKNRSQICCIVSCHHFCRISTVLFSFAKLTIPRKSLKQKGRKKNHTMNLISENDALDENYFSI